MRLLQSAQSSLAGAALTALLLLALVSRGGGWALAAGAGLALLTQLPAPRRRRGLGRDIVTLGRAAGVATAGVVILATLFAPGGASAALAWFGRALCLASLATLPLTSQRWLPAHALAAALALWNAAACEVSSTPSAPSLALGALALGLCLRGVHLAHAEELDQRAARSITTGVAPTPWGLREVRLPALLVVALALVPTALGISWPRLSLEPDPPAARAAAARSGAQLPRWEIGFAPELRVDEARGSALAGETEIARVRLSARADELYLRGATLSRIEEEGFFPPADALREELGLSARLGASPLVAEIEQLLPQDRALFTVGRPLRLSGVPAELSPQGWVLRGDPSFPLSYRVEAEGPPGVRDLDLLRARREPALWALPASVAEDSGLEELANTVAWGRSPHARVTNLTRWLRGRCRYRLRRGRPAGLNQRGLLRHFLDRQQSGACEEFAAAACLLLRRVGVPVRVVTGFRSVERDDEGRFRVRARHAHAWIEVAYEGVGWVPYDPTPGVEVEAALAGASPPLAEAPGRSALASPDPEGSDAASSSLPAPLPLWRLVILALAAALGLALLLAPRRLRRAHREWQLRERAPTPRALPIDDLRGRLFALLQARGFFLEGAETPREFLASLLAEAGEETEGRERAAALNAALELYLPLRFSARATPSQRAALEAALRRLERP